MASDIKKFEPERWFSIRPSLITREKLSLLKS